MSVYLSISLLGFIRSAIALYPKPIFLITPVPTSITFLAILLFSFSFAIRLSFGLISFLILSLFNFAIYSSDQYPLGSINLNGLFLA